MSTGHFYGVTYQKQLLSDRIRTGVLHDAIKELVKPGDVVVDVGTGSGILSIFAARAGARKVYAIESTPIARLARQVVADNGLSHIIEVIEADARVAQLGELADVLISECLGNFVLSDAMLNVLVDCKRMLKPNAIICPGLVRFMMAPANLEPLMGALNWWKDPHYEVNWNACYRSAQNDVYPVQVPPELLSAEPKVSGRVFITEPPPKDPQHVLWTFDKATSVDAVVGWFTAELSPSVMLDTSPAVQTCWGQVAFPIPPIDVVPGDQLDFTLAFELGELDLPAYRWTGAYLDDQCVEAFRFERGQDLRFEPWRAVDEEA